MIKLWIMTYHSMTITHSYNAIAYALVFKDVSVTPHSAVLYLKLHHNLPSAPTMGYLMKLWKTDTLKSFYSFTVNEVTSISNM